MKAPANTGNCHTPSPCVPPYIAPPAGLPISMPRPTKTQYIPDRVPMTPMEGQKRGKNAPGRATRTPDIMPQDTDQAIVPGTSTTVDQQNKIMEPNTRQTAIVSVGPNMAPASPASSRPMIDAPLRIVRRSNPSPGCPEDIF